MKRGRTLSVLVIIGAVTLLFVVGTADSEPARYSAVHEYAFRLGSGLNVAPIGSPMHVLTQRLAGHNELTPIHFRACTELRYTVGAVANRNKNPDLLAFYCKPSNHVVEIHLRSNVFCTTADVCIRTPGSLRRLVAAMGADARLSKGECFGGGSGCDIVTRANGQVVTELRSANCRTLVSLQIPTRCVVAEVLIYKSHA